MGFMTFLLCKAGTVTEVEVVSNSPFFTIFALEQMKLWVFPTSIVSALKLQFLFLSNSMGSLRCACGLLDLFASFGMWSSMACLINGCFFGVFDTKVGAF